MTDPAEIRAEGRRLLAEYRRVTDSPRDYYERLAAGSKWSKWTLLHADVILADPAPVGLTEDERAMPAVPCCHPSSTGVDQAPMDPAKVWRCDACGWLHRTIPDPDKPGISISVSAAPVDDRGREGEVIDNVRAFLTEIVQSNPPHPDAAFEMVQSLAKVHLRALAERPVSPSVAPEEGP